MALSDEQITQIRERLDNMAEACLGYGDLVRDSIPFSIGLPTFEQWAKELRDALALVDQLREERDAVGQLKDIALAELAGYRDGFEGLPHWEHFKTADENMAYVLWFGKGRAERTALIEAREAVERRWKESDAALARLRTALEAVEVCDDSHCAPCDDCRQLMDAALRLPQERTGGEEKAESSQR